MELTTKKGKIMKTIHILSTLAALALLAASCTDQYAPAEDSPAAMAGAPIAISVAPPPAFTEVAATTRGNTAAANNRQPATRASQTDKATQWKPGDILWLQARFYEDKETANISDPGNSTQVSALKYTGTAWSMLSPHEVEEIGANVLPDFVLQLHWPKEIEGWKAPVMCLKTEYMGDRKPDADGKIIITPEGEAPTTPTLYSKLTWVTPDEASTKLELRNSNMRLLIPAGYSVKWAEYIRALILNKESTFNGSRISAQPKDTYMFVHNTSTIVLEKDGKEIAFTLPPITDEEGRPTREGASYSFASYSNGAETPLTPGTYDLLISNEKELRAFAEAVNNDKTITGPNGPVPAREAKVLQTANITLGSEEWTPIGEQSSFEGRYNGNGHIIENMKITKGIQVVVNSQKYIYAGMFGRLSNAVLTGINLRNVTIKIDADNTINNVRAGSLAGEAFCSTISLCSATGQVTVKGKAERVQAGGIAGYTVSPVYPANTISRCRATVEVEAITGNAAGNTYAGGIVGETNPGCFILSCEAQGKTITAEASRIARAGGIAGWNSPYGIIAFCHAGNTVKAQKGGDTNYAGGLIGNNQGYLYASYTTGDATATSTGGSNKAGILVGYNYEADRAQHCYGTGTASPDNSNLAAAADNIVYNRNPADGNILTLMQKHTDAVESIPGYPDEVPFTTRYDPSASPAYGIEPIPVKWTSAAWKQGSDPRYPEIDREYEGLHL